MRDPEPIRGGHGARGGIVSAALTMALLAPGASALADAGRMSAEEGIRNDMFLISSLQAILLILLLLWYLVLARRRELDATVRRPFETFCQEHEAVLARLEALTQHHRRIAGCAHEGEAISGETLQSIQSVEALLSGVSQTWLEVMEVRDDIGVQLRSPMPLGAAAITRLRAQLAAQKLVEQANADLAACEETLNKLGHAAEDATALVEAIGSLRDAARKNLAAMEAAGSSPMAYEPSVRAVEEALGLAERRLIADPLGMEASLQQIQNRAAFVAEWTAKALYHRQGADEAWGLLHEVANEAIACRRGGFLLAEDGGSPDPLLRLARVEHEATRRALERGEVELAERHLQQCFAGCEQARQGIQRQVAARSYGEEMIPLLHRRAEAYVAALQGAEEKQKELETDFAEESWSGVSTALPSARALFQACRTLMTQVEEASAADRQHYFLAEDLLVHVDLQLRRGEGLLHALDARAAHLRHLRAALQRGIEEVEATRNKANAIIREARHAMSAGTLAFMDESEKEWVEVGAALKTPRADWPELDARVRAALARFRRIADQARDEAQAHEEGRLLLARLREKEAEVGALLQGHHEQHDRATALFEQTREALERIEKELATPGLDWLDAVSRLTSLHDQFQRAARWTVDGLSPPRQAALEIKEAEEALHAAQSYYRVGVSADASAAEEHLQKARHALLARKYAEALAEAADAADEARRAQQSAQRASRKQHAGLPGTRVRFDFESSDSAPDAGHATFADTPEPISAPPLEQRPTFPSRTWRPAASTAATQWAATARPAPPAQ